MAHRYFRGYTSRKSKHKLTKLTGSSRIRWDEDPWSQGPPHVGLARAMHSKPVVQGTGRSFSTIRGSQAMDIHFTQAWPLSQDLIMYKYVLPAFGSSPLSDLMDETGRSFARDQTCLFF